jgi:hypothetical protein
MNVSIGILRPPVMPSSREQHAMNSMRGDYHSSSARGVPHYGQQQQRDYRAEGPYSTSPGRGDYYSYGRSRDYGMSSSPPMRGSDFRRDDLQMASSPPHDYEVNHNFISKVEIKVL